MTAETTRTNASPKHSGSGTGANEGVIGNLAKQTQNVVGGLQTSITENGGPLLDRAKKFARERPYATATLAGVIGLAILGTLRARR